MHCNRLNRTRRWFTVATLIVVACSIVRRDAAAADATKVRIQSTLDGVTQPCYILVPDGYDENRPPVPLLVSLHSWSADLEQQKPTLEEMANDRGWIMIYPNFRGPNLRPEACGSPKAQQDILDAVEWTKMHYRVDKKRIYLTGVSGGGHMTMLMAARHPQVWAAASAWVGISDLKAWYAKHADTRYGEMMRKCCGGAPGDSDAVDQQYRARSPLTFLKNAAKVPLDISAGVHDGHTGSVPVRHSLEAFNEVAKAVDAQPITEKEILQISRKNGRLDNPLASDQVRDPTYARKIYLRRHAGASRVTIFEGGHEGIVAAAVAWLEKHHQQ